MKESGYTYHWIFVIVLYFYDGFYNHSTSLQNVENFRFLPNVENYVVWLILDLIELLVQLYQVNEAPLFEEGQALKEGLSS